MKFFSFIFFLCVSAILNAQIVTIPDANFKNALVNENVVDIDGDGIGDEDADLNNDGEIQVNEAEAIFSLNIFNKGIVSLEGLQSFVNIEYLNCGDNQITQLDISPNTNLKFLFCQNNTMTSLVLQNPILEELYCWNNLLASLDISQSINLLIVDCSDNQLTSLITVNPNLEWLWCFMNNIKEIDISQNSSLEWFWASDNFLTNIDVTQNTNLLRLYVDTNELTNIDVTQNLNLEDLDCDNNFLTNIDVSQNQNIKILSLNNNQFTNIDISKNSNLEWLYLSNNLLKSIDVSTNPSLIGVYGFNNSLTYMNAQNGANTILEYLSVFNNPDLNCIQVDDVTYAENQVCISNNGWCKDEWTSYSELCELGIENYSLSSIALFPNPVQEQLKVYSKLGIDNIQILSIQGVILKETTANNSINVSSLPNGVYFANISIGGQRIVKRFVKS